MPQHTRRNDLTSWKDPQTQATGRDATVCGEVPFLGPGLPGAAENRRLLRVYGGALLIAWLLPVVSAWHGARQKRHPDAVRAARSVPPLAIARAAALCEKLAPGDGPLALNVWRAEGRGSAPSARPGVADWTDARGEPAGTFYWDGLTGELSYASLPERPAPARRTALTAAQATRTGRDWLRLLRLGTSGASRTLPWIPDGAPVQSGGDWLVRWCAGDRRALVHVSARTGALVSGACLHVAPPASAPRKGPNRVRALYVS